MLDYVHAVPNFISDFLNFNFKHIIPLVTMTNVTSDSQSDDPNSVCFNRIFHTSFVVASKCSQSHFSFLRNTKQLHFLQNSPLVQLYTFVRDCKCVESIPRNHFVKESSAFPLYS